MNEEQKVKAEEAKRRRAELKRGGRPEPSWEEKAKADEAVRRRRAELVHRQGNESRLTSSWAQYLQQVLWIPAGALAAALDGLLVGDLAHQIEGEVADHCHVFGAMNRCAGVTDPR